MSHIASIDEFAYAIRLDPTAALEHKLLLELAEGLVIEQLGELDPWPTKAKAIVLAASARAFFNPAGSTRVRLGASDRSFAAGRMGVYLDEDELDDLNGKGKQPTYSFPGTWPYPDPVERPADTVSG